jgi:LPXTG-motif cell wall-anchored protein
MSALANAHAGTAAGSGYPDVVCCSGPAGLSASCGGPDATVLTLSPTVLWPSATVLKLSATDNAHVAEASDMTYTTQACLSATGTTITCQYASSCTSGYTCLASISGSTNAHVADCDGTNDYGTKVCCSAGAAPAVGGIAEPPDATRSASGSSSPPYAALAGVAGAAVLLLMAGGWYARRRRRAG